MFSVVIPHLNRPEDLMRAIRSIDIQSKLIIDLIVVDNGSDERVLDELAMNLPKHRKLKLINLPYGNANTARNIGIDKAKGQWIVFCDDDDWFEPNKFQVLHDVINSEKHCDLIYNQMYISLDKTGLKYISKISVPEGQMDIKNHLTNTLGGTSGLTIKKEVLCEIGKFDEKLASLQDHELYLRLASAQKKLTIVKVPLTNYAKGLSRGQVSQSAKKLKQSLTYINTKYAQSFSKLNDNFLKKKQNWEERLFITKNIESGNWREIILNIQPKHFLHFVKVSVRTAILLLGNLIWR